MNAFFGSVRGRLTLHSLLVTAPVVAGLLIALYFGALSAFEAQDRTELEEETETALALLSARPELPPSSALAPLLNEADGVSDSHLWLGRADAPLLAKPAGSRLQPLPEGVRWRDLKLNEIVIGEGRDAQGQRQRVASVRLPSTAGGELHLQIARLLKPPAQQRLHWRLGLAAVFLLLVALSTLITWVMTGRTLRPVMRMIVAAENYDPGRNRLPVSAAGDDEFAALALSLNRILARLEDATLQSRRFSADAAHELRTPLAGLRVMLEVAQSRPRSPKEMAQLFGDALDELTRIDRRLDALLRLARIEAGERPAAGPQIAIAAWCAERLQPWRRE